MYGDSADKIIQGNVANIVFLKSTDDAMLDTLEKLSGKTHEALIEQKTITRDNDKMLMKNEGKISYTMSTKERAVIQFNDMLFIPERNSMVFRAGGSPIWNKNQTILPMSWRLLKDTIKVPGTEYSLQTVPTLSTALDFDIRKNQPDVIAMLQKRLKQARMVDDMREKYMDAYGYNEAEMIRLDPDVLSDELMISINETLYGTGIDSKEVGPWVEKGYETKEDWQDAMRKIEAQQEVDIIDISVDNDELSEDLHEREGLESEANLLIHADGRISKRMLINDSGSVNMELQNVFSIAYDESKQHFANARSGNYIYNPEEQTLRSAQGGTLFVENLTTTDEEAFQEAAESQDSTLYSEETDFNDTGLARFRVTAEFVKHLASLPDWKILAGGRFEMEVAKAYDKLKTM